MKIFEPTSDERRELLEWFSNYDQLTKNEQVTLMADQGSYPMFVVTDDSKGNGVAKSWTREEFIRSMEGAMANTPKDLVFDTTRTPWMVGPNLAVVFTEWRTQGGKEPMILKYIDVLVKENGKWKFQTMVQNGWGDFLRE